MRNLSIILLLVISMSVSAQIGQHRNDLSFGVNAGYSLSSVAFNPTVPQGQYTGLTGGLSLRYVCEKYFNTICSIYTEVNYTSLGWKEDILDANDNAVINKSSGLAENYSRKINYIQVPIFAHLAWGKEKKGMQFFFQAGPQFGVYINESTSSNFDFATRNTVDRVNSIVAQDTMSVENKFDYGIAGGLGVEYSVPYVGHFLAEARYYYGLGNIFGDSKRDYFGKSNFGNIVLKMTYLFDIKKPKNK